MAKRKLTKIEKIILAGVSFMAVFMVGFWILDKKPDRDFYLPNAYEGWVMIKYDVPHAPPLAMEDGVMQIHISDSGYAETSTPLSVGWRKDRYFRVRNEKVAEIPSSIKKDGEYFIHIHTHAYYSKSYEYLLQDLPAGIDTVLPDNTHIIKSSDREVEYRKGKKTLEYFYVSRQPESILFNPPPKTNNEALETTEDRAIPMR